MKKSVKKFIYEKFPHILKKKILLYTCSHNYAEINGKLKKKKKSHCKTKEAKYCTLAENLFHH